ncbi:AarF/UbiB family protein [Actinomarinicola tropica]|uniref:AarF/UbiB family protein n=1 Tax=Actinomarinicola tropica TaxID=2789776 RepID=UPI0038990547
MRVPTVHWELTSPRVLTMERMHGYKIDDLVELAGHRMGPGSRAQARGAGVAGGGARARLLPW